MFMKRKFLKIVALPLTVIYADNFHTPLHSIRRGHVSSRLRPRFNYILNVWLIAHIYGYIR